MQQPVSTLKALSPQELAPRFEWGGHEQYKQEVPADQSESAHLAARLCGMLQAYAGEHGENEGAADLLGDLSRHYQVEPFHHVDLPPGGEQFQKYEAKTERLKAETDDAFTPKNPR